MLSALARGAEPEYGLADRPWWMVCFEIGWSLCRLLRLLHRSLVEQAFEALV